MHGPDGRDYQNRVTFDEIVRPERIAYHHGGGDGQGGYQNSHQHHAAGHPEDARKHRGYEDADEQDELEDHGRQVCAAHNHEKRE